MTKAAKQSGFTMIEALVALMILAIAATSIIAAFGAGARQSASRLARYELFRAAQTRLSLLKVETRSSGAVLDRQFAAGGYQIVETARVAAAPDAREGALALFEISVVVQDGAAQNGRSATLTDFVVARVSP